jgi:hypothetical protein
MAKMIQVPYQSDIIVPVETAQSVQKNRENPISLQALGLLVNLLSYPTSWELHKTELYKRFGKDGERPVRTAWNDLLEANYIIEFKYRVGRKWEYVYYFRKVPFTVEEKAEILAAAEKEYGEIWGLRNEVPKMKSSKRRGNQDPLLKQDLLLNNKKQYIDYTDDDKRTSPSEEASAIHNEESINLLISNLRESTKDELSGRSFKAVVRKVIDKYNQGKVNSFRDYFVTSLVNKILELELRRAKDAAKEQLTQSKQQRFQKKVQELEQQELKNDLPFYDWLN